MPRPTKVCDEIFRAILQSFKNGATVKGACGAAGISTSTLHLWRLNYPDFDEQIQIARNTAIGVAETALHTAVQKGNVGAIKYFLNMRAGYKDVRMLEMEELLIYKHDHLQLAKDTTADLLLRQIAYSIVSADYRPSFKHLLLGENAKDENAVPIEDVPHHETAAFFMALGIARIMAEKLGLPSTLPEYDVLPLKEYFKNIDLNELNVVLPPGFAQDISETEPPLPLKPDEEVTPEEDNREE
jgi:hypothetical protein